MQCMDTYFTYTLGKCEIMLSDVIWLQNDDTLISSDQFIMACIEAEDGVILFDYLKGKK